MKKLTEEEIEKNLKDLKNWKLKNNAITAEFEFDDFKQTFGNMTLIAFEAENLGHHPEWKNVYNQLNISLSTHDARGITQKDFDMAKAIDKIIEGK